MPKHVVRPTLHDMCSERSSECPSGGTDLDNDRYGRLQAFDPVLWSIALSERAH